MKVVCFCHRAGVKLVPNISSTHKYYVKLINRLVLEGNLLKIITFLEFEENIFVVSL